MAKFTRRHLVSQLYVDHAWRNDDLHLVSQINGHDEAEPKMEVPTIHKAYVSGDIPIKYGFYLGIVSLSSL